MWPANAYRRSLETCRRPCGCRWRGRSATPSTCWAASRWAADRNGAAVVLTHLIPGSNKMRRVFFCCCKAEPVVGFNRVQQFFSVVVSGSSGCCPLFIPQGRSAMSSSSSLCKAYGSRGARSAGSGRRCVDSLPPLDGLLFLNRIAVQGCVLGLHLPLPAFFMKSSCAELARSPNPHQINHQRPLVCSVEFSSRAGTFTHLNAPFPALRKIDRCSVPDLYSKRGDARPKNGLASGHGLRGE